MGQVAKELEKAWEESAQESGFLRGHEKMTIYRAEKAREKFYQLFFKKTGMHDSLVRGLFNDWNKQSSEEAEALRQKHGVQNGFCAYMADYLEKKVASAGTSTAYTYPEGEISGELH